MKYLLLILLTLFSLSSLSAETNNGIIRGSNVNLRSEPSLKSNILKKLSIHENVTIVSISDIEESINGDSFKWINIRTNENIFGWVSEKYISFMNPKANTFEYYKNKIITHQKMLYEYFIPDNLEFENIEDYGMIVLYGYDYSINNRERRTYVYLKNGDSINLILSLYQRNCLFFYNKYILSISEDKIFLYKINDYLENKIDNIFEKKYWYMPYYSMISLDEESKTIKNLNLNRAILDFNKEENIINVLPWEKAEPVRRYIIKNGNFVKTAK